MNARVLLIYASTLTPIGMHGLNPTEEAIKACINATNENDRIVSMQQLCQQRLKDAGIDENQATCEMVSLNPGIHGMTHPDLSTTSFTQTKPPKTHIKLNKELLSNNKAYNKVLCPYMGHTIEHEIGHAQQFQALYNLHGLDCNNHNAELDERSLLALFRSIDDIHNNNIPLLRPDETTNIENDADHNAVYKTETPCMLAYSLRRCSSQRPPEYLSHNELLRLAEKRCRENPHNEYLYKELLERDRLELLERDRLRSKYIRR